MNIQGGSAGAVELLPYDGRSSIEHQLSIHIVDLFDVRRRQHQGTRDQHIQNNNNNNNDILLADVLAGIKYVMEYRIRGHKQPHLDKQLMKSLADGLLIHMKDTERDFPLVFERFTDEADLAFDLFGEFIEEVEEFRQVVAAIPAVDLAHSLRIHVRCKSTETRESALNLLGTFRTFFPNQFTLAELVRKDYENVADLMNSFKYSPLRPLIRPESLFPPQALYFDRNIDRLLDMFSTSLERGLPSSRVPSLVEAYGHNDLPQPTRASVLKIIWGQVFDFMVLILIVAAVFSAAMGEYDSCVTLFVVVIINVVIGFVQELKANRALEALLSMTIPLANVIRDGETLQIPTRELVPGDVVVLNEGELVPADLRLAEVSNFEVMEAILTGESVGIFKSTDAIKSRTRKLPLGDCHGNAFMSTLVSRGRAKGIVVRIGAKTEMGKISAAISSAPETKTPMQVRLKKLGIILVVVSVILCVLVVVIGAARGQDPLLMIQIGITLAVSVIPEGLVAVSTITMAIGVTRMAAKGAIIRKLPSVESLGSVTVICSDKTGTLTEGKMRATEIWSSQDFGISFSGQGPTKYSNADEKPESLLGRSNMLLMACAECNNATVRNNPDTGQPESFGDPTELALLGAASDLKYNSSAVTGLCKRLHEIAFDSDRKMMSVIVETEKIGNVMLSKGAPEAILEKCSHYLSSTSDEAAIDSEYLFKVSNNASRMAASGLRVLGLAFKRIKKDDDDTFKEADLVFSGLIGLIDPPRAGVRESIDLCHSAGIKVIMITGDHAITAAAIATQLGILPPGGHAVKGSELDLLTDEALKALNPFPTVFARVSPDNKLRIVKALQSQGNSVAMTGDGVNDAPAIKAANIGIAMGIVGTEITKQAADMILSNDNFTTIESAVQEGRRVYDNIQKFVFYLLSCNFAEIFVMLLSVIIGIPLPFTAMMILLANIIADIPPSMSLGVEPAEEDIMNRKPRNPESGVLDFSTSLIVIYQSITMGLISLVVYILYLVKNEEFVIGKHEVPFSEEPYGIQEAQSLAFMVLTVMQLFQSFLSRSTESSIFKMKFFGNKWTVMAFLFSFCAMIFVNFVPVVNTFFTLVPLDRWEHWGVILLACFIQLIISELVKSLRRWVHRRKAAIRRLNSTDSFPA